MSCNKSLFHRNLYSIFQVIPERLLYILRNNVYVILCAICDFLHVCFSRFLNYTNGTKSRNAPQFVSSREMSFEISLVVCTFNNKWSVTLERMVHLFLHLHFV